MTIACHARCRHQAKKPKALETQRPIAIAKQWRAWRTELASGQEWNQAIAPVVAARRRAYQLLHDKQAVRILFETLGPRFADRPGGYTRILHLATPRLGDAGARSILEFVGQRDRVQKRAEKPAFETAVE